MWWKLAALAALEVALIAALVWCASTYSVPTKPVTGGEALWVTIIGRAALVLVAFIPWLAYRVIRRARISN
ncbi:MAG TPA: hypothetical protein VN154_01115 [Rhizomicrobium sp.]|nr:hypothetical protein [Rhizomicrobium sp.]